MNCVLTKKAHLITLFLLLFTVYGIAQIQDCSVDIFEDEALLHSSQQHQANLEFEPKYQDFIKSGKKLNFEDGIFEGLPIVFHIVHEGDSLGSVSNPRYEQIFDLIEKTNNYFRQLNEEQNTFENPFYGADTEINFCLANRDENGDPSSGIIRYVSSNIGNTYLLDLLWDTKRYINVFYINDIAPGICGTYSSGSDIIRVVNRCVTKSILAHELGHYLDLKHTFLIDEDCSNEDCTKQGDLVCDTPPKFASTTTALEGFEGQPCLYPANTCHTDEDDVSANNPYRSVALGGMGDQADPNSNIMGYANTCRNNFTQGQAIRMQMNLLEKRQTLWNQSSHCDSRFRYDNDVGVKSVWGQIEDECNKELILYVNMINYGSEILESATIEVKLNGTVLLVEEWLGYLHSGESETISLNVKPLIGQNKVSVIVDKPNGAIDFDMTKNEGTTTIGGFGSNVDYDFFMADIVVYSDSSLNLGVRANSGFIPYYFLWRRQNGTISNNLNQNKKLTVSESDTYYLTIYNVDYSCYVEYTANVEFLNLENLRVVSNRSTQLCDESEVQLMPNYIPAGATIFWYREGFMAPFASGETYVAPAAGRYRFEAVFESTESETFSIFSDWYTISSINQLSFEFQTKGLLSCVNPVIQLSTTLDDDDPYRYDYNWSFNRGGLEVELDVFSHPTYFEDGDFRILNVDKKGIYALEIIDRWTSCSRKKWITIESIPSMADIEVDFLTDYQPNESFMLEASFNSADIAEMEWTVDGGGKILNGRHSAIVQVEGFGVYSFRVKSNLGCETIYNFPVIPRNKISLNTNCMSEDTTNIQRPYVEAYIEEDVYFQSGSENDIRWYNENGTALHSDPSSSAVFDSAGNYFVEIYNSDGTYIIKKDLKITEEMLFVPESILLPVDTLVCGNEERYLDGSASSIAVNTLVSWKDARGETITNDLYTTVAGSGAFSLELINPANGCFSKEEVKLNDIHLSLHAGSNKLLNCQESEVLLGETQASEDFTFEWFQIINSDTLRLANTAQYVTDQTGTFFLNATYGSSTCSFTDDVQVHDVEDFAQIVVWLLDEMCIDSSILLSINILNEFSNYELRWNFPDGNVSDLPVIPVTDEGRYILQLVDFQSGCEKRDTFDFYYQFSLEFDSRTNGLSVLTKGGRAPFTYSWNNGSSTKDIDGLIDGSLYEVSVTDANNCQQIISTIYKDSMPIVMEEIAPSIILSPNPTNGILNIEFEEKNPINLEINVFNVEGKELKVSNFEDVQNDVLLDLGHLPNGVYILQLQINESYTYHKIILTR